jgi:15-cis-phytoene synthase
LALYAFDLEVARIRDSVSEPGLGEIRQQWWLDTLDAIYAREVPAHPVAQDLARAIEKGDLPKHSFRNLIVARQFDLYSDPMPSLHDLEGYFGETVSSVIQLASLVLAGPDALGSAEAAGLAGVAEGMTQLLRNLPLQRARGQCYVPKDMLTARDLTPADILEGKKSAAMNVLLAELRQHAEARLTEARGKHWLIPRPALPAYLHLAILPLYLAKLAKMGANVLTQKADVLQVRRQVKLFTAAWTETY